MKSLLKQSDYSREWVKDFNTQAGVWWGDDPQAPGVHDERVKLVERLCGRGPKRILDLGAGGAGTVAALADYGHGVVGAELNPTDTAYALELFRTPLIDPVIFLEADFNTVELEGQFDVVTCWPAFGIGSDADQRRLLKRIAQEWLATGGSVLVELINPVGPARDHGKGRRLNPLPACPAGGDDRALSLRSCTRALDRRVAASG